MCHISGLGVSATSLSCCHGNGKAGGPELATRSISDGNDRWVPDVFISGPVMVL